MKAISTLALLAVVLAPATASANLDLAKKHACTACHAVDKKLVGPSYQDVAAKYKGDTDTVTKLTASIRAGGAGKWGPIPMPAQAQLTEAEAKTLANWVAQGAK